MQNSATTKYVQEAWANDMVARAKMVQEGWTRESKTKKLLKLAIKRDHVARTELAQKEPIEVQAVKPYIWSSHVAAFAHFAANFVAMKNGLPFVWL